MTAPLPEEARFCCRDNGMAMVVNYWPDGSRTVEWLGLWASLVRMWKLIRAGVPVEVE